MTIYNIQILFITTSENLIVNDHVFENLLECPHIKPIPKHTLSLFLSPPLSLSPRSSLPSKPILCKNRRWHRCLGMHRRRRCHRAAGAASSCFLASQQRCGGAMRCLASRTKQGDAVLHAQSTSPSCVVLSKLPLRQRTDL